MVTLTRVTLDVLKPREPTIVDLAMQLGQQGEDYEVRVRVVEMDDKTETLEVVVMGSDIDLAKLDDTIARLGGSIHSIDEVTVNTTSPKS